MSPIPTKIRASTRDGKGEIRLLLNHPMESGQRRDAEGRSISPHYLQTLKISLNGRLLIDAELGPAVARNPLFAFQIDEARAGDKLTVSWTDNTGESRTDEAVFEQG